MRHPVHPTEPEKFRKVTCKCGRKCCRGRYTVVSGHWLRWARSYLLPGRGMTQQQVSDQIGITPASISLAELGTINPPVVLVKFFQELEDRIKQAS